MSLVAYDSSGDESGNEDEVSGANLPQISKKTREPVKITIPSLHEFKEVTDPEPLKKPKSQGGCGLFSILPPPKNTSTFSKPGFTPYVFSKKKETKASSPQVIKPKVEAVDTKKVLESAEVTDFSVEPDTLDVNEPDDSFEKVDFFSLEANTLDKSVSAPATDTVLEESVTEVPDSSSVHASSENQQYSSSNEYGCIDNCYSGNEIADVSVSNIVLPEHNAVANNWEAGYAETSTNSEQNIFEDKEFLRLAGKRKKEEINIIDVNADDQLTGKDEWLMQSLTEEKIHRPSKRRHDMPTSQQKRKHQITYLAFQAKERELDLKNQWALNSRTRRETQAKYGF